MDNPETNHHLADETPVCSQCGNNPSLKEYPVALCADCRENFVKFPIPKWVKGVGITVLLLVIVGLVTFPNQISTGLHLKRAEIALNNNKYVTAEKELHKVLESSPDLANAKVQLMIATFYNMDFPKFAKLGSELRGVTLESTSDLNRLNEISNEFVNYYPSDSFDLMIKRFPSIAQIPQDSFKLYAVSHPQEPFAMEKYVEVYVEKENLHWCDSSLRQILFTEPDYLPAIMSAISIARREGKYDTALKYCDDLLAINSESTYAISAKARILMVQNEVNKGIELTRKAIALDPDDGYSLATLALGYHLNHQTAERDKLINRATKDSALAEYMDYINNIISGKEKFK